MSWAVQAMAVTVNGELEDRLNEAVQNADQAQFALTESQEQAAAAVDAVVALVDAAVVGDASVINVSMSGHANENHENREGYANSMVSISISKVS